MSVILYALVLGNCNNSFAQINITPTQNALDLANTVAGNGGTIIGATLNCPNGAVGTFTNGGSTNLGLESGIVLTTGQVSSIAAPGSTFSSSGNNAPGLAILETIAGVSTNDACYLDIDIKPICSVLRINYVFGSEEWPEWAGSGVNDAFGFFMTGPKPDGTNYTNANIAFVPGTGDPVTINTINANQNASYYIDNSAGNTIVYDAFTKMLTATLSVVPCKTYQLRLAIADGGDEIYDSGVFLQAGGITCNLNVTASAPTNDICKGSSVVLSALSTAATGTLMWNTGHSGSSITVSPAVSTIYTVTANSCGHTAQDTVTIKVHDHDTVGLSYPQSVYCKSGLNPVPTLIGSGGTVTAWPPGLAINATTGIISLAGSQAGIYSVKYTLNNVCADSATQLLFLQKRMPVPIKISVERNPFK